MQHLARSIARDGEGATCLIEVQVAGLTDEAEALRVARTICGSSLVKTAVHGRDPNWGRIVAAAGRAGVPFLSGFSGVVDWRSSIDGGWPTRCF